MGTTVTTAKPYDDAMSNVTTYHYDPNGNRTSERIDGELNDVAGGAGNVRLFEATFQYDAMDRNTIEGVAFFVTQTQAPLLDGVATTSRTYANNSQVTAVTDDASHTTAYLYDTVNRRLTVTDPKTNTATYSYDANSNLTSTVELDKSDLGAPNQTFTTTYFYDGLDRLIRSVDNVGNQTLWNYDSRNNRVLETDPDGNKTRFVYDALDRLITTAHDLNGNNQFNDSADSITLQLWDDSSRPREKEDDKGNTTTYSYDALDRLIQTQNADGTSQQDTYNGYDDDIETIDPNGTIVNQSFDQMGRPTNKTIARAPGVQGTTTETYQYDGLSRTVSAQDDDSVVTRQYDSLNHVIVETQQLLPSGPIRTITAEYDGVGNQTRLVYPGGRLVVRTYDSLDRPSLIRDEPPSTIATYSYLGPYRVERRDYGNGTRFTPTYDGIRRMTNSLHSRIADSSVIDQRSSGWDAASNRTSATNNQLVPIQTRTYSYDGLNRLISTNGGLYWSGTGYTLDGASNRTTVTGGPDAGTYTQNATLPEPADSQMNQYTTTPFDSRQYDKNGSLVATTGQTAGATRTLAYDYRNQLVEFSDGSQTGSYRYDCFGRRIQRITAQRPVIDGTLDVIFYGTARTIQNSLTGFGDSNLGQLDFANGSELDGPMPALRAAFCI
jgi:YD repeat-containing protein